MKQLIIVLAFLIGTLTSAQKPQKRQIAAAQIDAVFSQWNNTNKPGIAVGVLNDGDIIFTKGYGLANLEHQVPISPETRFQIGDIAKEFTVYALLLLEKRGQLSLQDDIRKYLPKLMLSSNTISIEQLLHHTSGLNNQEVTKALTGFRQEDVLTKEQAYTMIRNQSKSSSFGDNVQRFSDAGFMVLEDIIAKVGNMAYSEFVSTEIFAPLGMKNSVFDIQGSVIPNKAQGYIAQGNEFYNATTNHRHTLLSDVYTTVADMCLWAKELGNPKVGTKQMLEKFDSLSKVNGQVIEENNSALYTGGHRFWDYRGAKKLYHIAIAGGYASKLIRYPEYNLAVVVMGNDGAYNGSAATAASELYIEEFLNKISNEPSAINYTKLTKNELAAFEGDYWDIDNHTSRKIHIENDTLRYFRGSGNESALVPLSKNNFKMITWGDVEVSFDTKSNPKTMKVTVAGAVSNLVAFDAQANWTNKLNSFVGNYYANDLDTSYTIVNENGKLVLSHPRMSNVHLTPKIPDLFTGDQPHFSSLAFKRDANQSIKGFQLATNGIADIYFEKEINFVSNKLKSK